MKKIYIVAILSLIVFLAPLSIGSDENKTPGNISNTLNVTSTSNVTSITYRSSVDQDYGFYRVIDITTHNPAKYENNTLTINIGDTVIWENDATPDEPLTIISEQGLWGNRSAYLRWNYQKFSYTFNQSGTYSVYIKEYPREKHQTIIVKDVSGLVKVASTPTMTNTVLPTTAIIEVDTTETPKINETVVIENSKREYVLYYIIAGFIIIVGIIVLVKRVNKNKKQ